MRKRILKLGQSTQWRLAVLAMTLMFAALLCMWSSMH